MSFYDDMLSGGTSKKKIPSPPSNIDTRKKEIIDVPENIYTKEIPSIPESIDTREKEIPLPPTNIDTREDIFPPSVPKATPMPIIGIEEPKPTSMPIMREEKISPQSNIIIDKPYVAPEPKTTVTTKSPRVLANEAKMKNARELAKKYPNKRIEVALMNSKGAYYQVVVQKEKSSVGLDKYVKERQAFEAAGITLSESEKNLAEAQKSLDIAMKTPDLYVPESLELFKTELATSKATLAEQKKEVSEYGVSLRAAEKHYITYGGLTGVGVKRQVLPKYQVISVLAQFQRGVDKATSAMLRGKEEIILSSESEMKGVTSVFDKIEADKISRGGLTEAGIRLKQERKLKEEIAYGGLTGYGKERRLTPEGMALTEKVGIARGHDIAKSSILRNKDIIVGSEAQLKGAQQVIDEMIDREGMKSGLTEFGKQKLAEKIESDKIAFGGLTEAGLKIKATRDLKKSIERGGLTAFGKKLMATPEKQKVIEASQIGRGRDIAKMALLSGGDIIVSSEGQLKGVKQILGEKYAREGGLTIAGIEKMSTPEMQKVKSGSETQRGMDKAISAILQGKSEINVKSELEASGAKKIIDQRNLEIERETERILSEINADRGTSSGITAAGLRLFSPKYVEKVTLPSLEARRKDVLKRSSLQQGPRQMLMTTAAITSSVIATKTPSPLENIPGYKLLSDAYGSTSEEVGKLLYVFDSETRSKEEYRKAGSMALEAGTLAVSIALPVLLPARAALFAARVGITARSIAVSSGAYVGVNQAFRVLMGEGISTDPSEYLTQAKEGALFGYAFGPISKGVQVISGKVPRLIKIPTDVGLQAGVGAGFSGSIAALTGGDVVESMKIGAMFGGTLGLVGHLPIKITKPTFQAEGYSGRMLTIAERPIIGRYKTPTGQKFSLGTPEISPKSIISPSSALVGRGVGFAENPSAFLSTKADVRILSKGLRKYTTELESTYFDQLFAISKSIKDIKVPKPKKLTMEVKGDTSAGPIISDVLKSSTWKGKVDYYGSSAFRSIVSPNAPKEALLAFRIGLDKDLQVGSGKVAAKLVKELSASLNKKLGKDYSKAVVKMKDGEVASAPHIETKSGKLVEVHFPDEQLALGNISSPVSGTSFGLGEPKYIKIEGVRTMSPHSFLAAKGSSASTIRSLDDILFSAKEPYTAKFTLAESKPQLSYIQYEKPSFVSAPAAFRMKDIRDFLAGARIIKEIGKPKLFRRSLTSDDIDFAAYLATRKGLISPSEYRDILGMKTKDLLSKYPKSVDTAKSFSNLFSSSRTTRVQPISITTSSLGSASIKPVLSLGSVTMGTVESTPSIKITKSPKIRSLIQVLGLQEVSTPRISSISSTSPTQSITAISQPSYKIPSFISISPTSPYYTQSLEEEDISLPSLVKSTFFDYPKLSSKLSLGISKTPSLLSLSTPESIPSLSIPESIPLLILPKSITSLSKPKSIKSMTYPSTPSVPSTPSIPSIPSINVPSITSKPSKPSKPSIPSILKVPSVPKISMPSTPSVSIPSPIPLIPLKFPRILSPPSMPSLLAPGSISYSPIDEESTLFPASTGIKKGPNVRTQYNIYIKSLKKHPINYDPLGIFASQINKKSSKSLPRKMRTLSVF